MSGTETQQEIERLQKIIEAQSHIIKSMIEKRPLTTAEISAVPAEARFWWYVEKSDQDKCWMWTGAVCRKYGRFSHGGESTRAHRFSLILATGEEPEGMLACHKCDNPMCVNPNHLYWGTSKQNTADRYARGRGITGDRHHAKGVGIIRKSDGMFARCKYTKEQVISVKELIMSGKTLIEIAQITGVHKSTGSKIKRGLQWAK